MLHAVRLEALRVDADISHVSVRYRALAFTGDARPNLAAAR
jgi:hypothetical protein